MSEALAAAAFGGIGLLYIGLLLFGVIDFILRVIGGISILFGSKDTDEKILWLLVVAVFPIGGGFIWLWKGR